MKPMKPKATLRCFSLFVACYLLTVALSHSADVIWDLSPGTVGAGDSAITGGAGTWNTVNGNWTTDAGANNIAWDNLNNDTAVFGGTAGAVNLLSNVSVGGLKFLSNGYSITSAANTIAFGVDGAIFTDTGVTAIIGQKVLSGSATVEKTGAGILTLGNNTSGDNTTFNGALKISEGTVRLAPYFNSTKTVGSFILNGGALHGWAGWGITQTTTNVSVTANSTISAGESGSASNQIRSLALGALSIGANTLTLTKHSGSSATTVSFTSTALSGNAVFDVLAGSYSPNTMANLGNLSDGGAGRTITKNGPGDLTWGTITLSGNHIWNVNQGTLTSGAITTAGFSLTKNGVGTLNVTGPLTGGGNVVLNGGTLNLANTTNAAGTLTLSASSTLGMGTGSTSFASSVADWDTPNVNLILTGTLGQATTNLRFGTDSTGLSANQLARITYNGLASGVAKPVSLDASGYVRSNAYDGNWNVNADGDWTDISKWTAGQASGADSTATLANNITLDRVVNLNTGVTVGHISALDGSHNYTISGGNILTLDTTTGIPSVSVGTAARTLIISSEIQGNDGLNKIGAGILLLSGSNSYTGGTTVTAGTLSIGHANALGAGAITLNAGTRIQSSDTTARILNNLPNIAGSDASPVSITGTGNLTFNNTGVGTFIGTSATIDVATGLTVTFNTAFSGTTWLHKKGAGTLILDGASTWKGSGTSGALRVLSGRLEFTTIGNLNGGASSLGSPTTLDEGRIALQGGTLAYKGIGSTTDRALRLSSPSFLEQAGTGHLLWNGQVQGYYGGGGNYAFTLQGSTEGTGEIAGSINDAFAGRNTAVTKTGTGTWTLSGTNSYIGATIVNQGILQFAKQVSLYSTTTPANWVASMINVKNGGTLAFNVGGTGEFTTGNVTTLLTNLGGANGTSTTGFAAGSAIGFDTTNASGGTFTVGDILADSTGTGGGAIGLTKLGTNTLVLSNTNTYTGATTVSAGTLNVSAGSINSTASLNVAAGGILRYNSSTALTVAPTLAGNGSSNRAVLGGSGNIGVAITLDNLGDVLSPGNSPGIQTYTTAQSWSSFTYDWEVNDFSGIVAGTHYDQVDINNTLDLPGGSGSYVLNVLGLDSNNVAGAVPNFSEINRSWTILTTSGGISNFNASSWSINTTGFSDPDTGNWSLAQNGNDLVLSYNVIPEPHVSLLGGLGVLLLLRRRR